MKKEIRTRKFRVHSNSIACLDVTRQVIIV